MDERAVDWNGRNRGDRVMRARFSDCFILVLVGLWGVVVTLGLITLWHYGANPGDGGAPPVSWPEQSKIIRNERPTLLVFAHPLCPCTLATLAELERLVAVCHNQVDTHVLFIAPEGTGASWQDTDLIRIARRIPTVGVTIDTQRHETDLFRVRTSGACLLYNASGTLLFRGGLTAVRGHEGDSQGSSSIKALLMHKEGKAQETSVFGCPLFETDNRSTRTESFSEQELHL